MRSAVRLVAALVLLTSAGPVLLAQCNQNCPEKRVISVNGTGETTADADLAIVHVGYKLYAADAKTAYANAVETSNGIMKALTDSGIPTSAIESTSQVLEHTPPYEVTQYAVNDAERRLHEFTVTQSWVIRVKPDQAGKALNTAVNAGANESGYIQWTVENARTLRAQAAASALADARATAERIAQRSGVRLGHLVSASENQGGAPSAYAGPVAINGAMDAVQFGNQQLAINSRRVQFVVWVFAEFAIE